MNSWIKVNTELERKMAFKSSDEVITLYEVTHYREYNEVASMIKHKDGVFFFMNDDVSWIASQVDDWII